MVTQRGVECAVTPLCLQTLYETRGELSLRLSAVCPVQQQPLLRNPGAPGDPCALCGSFLSMLCLHFIPCTGSPLCVAELWAQGRARPGPPRASQAALPADSSFLPFFKNNSWLGREDITLSERCQAQKNKHSVFLLMCKSQHLKKGILTEVDRRLVVTEDGQEREEEREAEQRMWVQWDPYLPSSWDQVRIGWNRRRSSSVPSPQGIPASSCTAWWFMKN